MQHGLYIEECNVNFFKSVPSIVRHNCNVYVGGPIPLTAVLDVKYGTILMVYFITRYTVDGAGKKTRVSCTCFAYNERETDIFARV